jgi:hypothetical protein
LQLLAGRYGVVSRIEPGFINVIVLARGEDEIAVPLNPPLYAVFAPIVIRRVLERFDITEEELRSAYNGWIERSGTNG